jgi:hypothetical protein
MERVAMELIPRMSEEAINKWDITGKTTLIMACENGMERVIKMIKDRIIYIFIVKKLKNIIY